GGRVKPHTSRELPRKHQKVSGSPENAVAAVEEWTEAAAVSLPGAPYSSTLAGSGVGDPDLPRRALAIGGEWDDGIGRSAHECDALAVRRPYGIDVVVDPRRDPANGFRREL